MAGTAIFYQPPFGLPGYISRPNTGEDIGSVALDQTSPPLLYGIPFKFSSGLATALATNDSASLVAGFLTASVPNRQPASNVGQGFGTTTPNKAYQQGYMKRGYMWVTCLGATAPVIDAPVFVRVRDQGSTGRAVGTVEADYGTFALAASACQGTGNGTININATPTATGVVPGVYRAVCIGVATNSGTFEVFDPQGVFIGRAVVGTLFNGVIKFTIADGTTDYAIGDFFNLTATADCEIIPGAFFAGSTRDSANVTEIRYNKP